MKVDLFGRALSSRNYRLYLIGQAISLIGTWMQLMAMSWLLYRLTASAFLLGLIGFSSQIPSLFLSPLAGVAADRWNRHRALLVTQTLAMIQAFLVLIVVNREGAVVWQLVGLGFFMGIVNAFDMPLRQSFLVEMVPDKAHLSHAIAVNSSIVNGARLIGPSLAGLVISQWGESACFLLNAVSYIAVIFALVAMRDLPTRPKPVTGKTLERLYEGLVYGFGFAPLRSLLFLMAAISIMSTSTSVLMPVFAKDILHGGANTQGLLMGAMGVGALVAAIYLASRKSVLGLGRAIVISSMVFGIGQIAFSFSTQLWISIPILVVTGCCMMLTMAGVNTLIQTIVEEDKRGRVMSLYSMAFLGVAPLGSLLGGSLAGNIGAPSTVRITGSVCVAAGIMFGISLPRLRKLVRPIYEEAGILPKQLVEH